MSTGPAVRVRRASLVAAPPPPNYGDYGKLDYTEPPPATAQRNLENWNNWKLGKSQILGDYGGQDIDRTTRAPYEYFYAPGSGQEIQVMRNPNMFKYSWRTVGGPWQEQYWKGGQQLEQIQNELGLHNDDPLNPGHPYVDESGNPINASTATIPQLMDIRDRMQAAQRPVYGGQSQLIQEGQAAKALDGVRKILGQLNEDDTNVFSQMAQKGVNFLGLSPHDIRGLPGMGPGAERSLKLMTDLQGALGQLAAQGVKLDATQGAGGTGAAASSLANTLAEWGLITKEPHAMAVAAGVKTVGSLIDGLLTNHINVNNLREQVIPTLNNLRQGIVLEGHNAVQSNQRLSGVATDIVNNSAANLVADGVNSTDSPNDPNLAHRIMSPDEASQTQEEQARSQAQPSPGAAPSPGATPSRSPTPGTPATQLAGRTQVQAGSRPAPPITPLSAAPISVSPIVAPGTPVVTAQGNQPPPQQNATPAPNPNVIGGGRTYPGPSKVVTDAATAGPNVATDAYNRVVQAAQPTEREIQAAPAYQIANRIANPLPAVTAQGAAQGIENLAGRAAQSVGHGVEAVGRTIGHGLQWLFTPRAAPIGPSQPYNPLPPGTPVSSATELPPDTAVGSYETRVPASTGQPGPIAGELARGQSTRALSGKLPVQFTPGTPGGRLLPPAPMPYGFRTQVQQVPPSAGGVYRAPGASDVASYPPPGTQKTSIGIPHLHHQEHVDQLPIGSPFWWRDHPHAYVKI